MTVAAVKSRDEYCGDMSGSALNHPALPVEAARLDRVPQRHGVAPLVESLGVRGDGAPAKEPKRACRRRVCRGRGVFLGSDHPLGRAWWVGGYRRRRRRRWWRPRRW